VERHIAHYFSRCGPVSKAFIEGNKCYIEFAASAAAATGRSASLFTRNRSGQVVVPEVPVALTLAYKCWSMERRRYRSSHDSRDTRYARVRAAAGRLAWPRLLIRSGRSDGGERPRGGHGWQRDVARPARVHRRVRV